MAETAEDNWSTPATRGDLKTLEAGLRSEISKQSIALIGKMNEQNLALRDRIDDQVKELRGDIVKLRVRIAWMSAVVVTVLGSLITLYQFLA